MLPEFESIGETVQETCLAGDAGRRRGGRRFSAAGQIRNQDPTMTSKSRSPGVKVLERTDEAMRQEQRRAGSLIEIPDPPAA